MSVALVGGDRAELYTGSPQLSPRISLEMGGAARMLVTSRTEPTVTTTPADIKHRRLPPIAKRAAKRRSSLGQPRQPVSAYNSTDEKLWTVSRLSRGAFLQRSLKNSDGWSPVVREQRRDMSVGGSSSHGYARSAVRSNSPNIPMTISGAVGRLGTTGCNLVRVCFTVSPTRRQGAAHNSWWRLGWAVIGLFECWQLVKTAVMNQ